MGSEQSNQASGQPAQRPIRQNPNFPERLPRGNTIASSSPRTQQSLDDSTAYNSPSESRPVSPPMSICSDSELPYIPYTDKPIGGKLFENYFIFHSPRNFLVKTLSVVRNNRS